MKVTIRKCPCCGGDYGVINTDSGSIIKRLRCRCEVKKEVIWTSIMFIAVLILAYFILGDLIHATKRPVREPTKTGTSLYKANTRINKLLLAVPLWGDSTKTPT